MEIPPPPSKFPRSAPGVYSLFIPSFVLSNACFTQLKIQRGGWLIPSLWCWDWREKYSFDNNGMVSELWDVRSKVVMI